MTYAEDVCSKGAKSFCWCSRRKHRRKIPSSDGKGKVPKRGESMYSGCRYRTGMNSRIIHDMRSEVLPD